ncbi:MAG: hypothetical protein JNN08_16835 [Bryobacterales bacterium]|nr:hypothetical protein [Bryobacterales bacterium]
MPSVQIPQEVARIRDRLREADYSGSWLLETGVPALRDFILQLKNAGEHLLGANVHRLWAQCLQAEILDYYARYDDALQVLEEDGRKLARALQRRDLLSDKDKPLLRQQLWTVSFYSHCYYRQERYQKAEELLKLVRRELDTRLPVSQDEPSFGLRARVAYSLGQVYRQMGSVGPARREFLSSVEFTRKRLESKLEKHKDNHLVRLREQKFANYVTAKVFSFGLTWAANNEGSLQRARGSAGAGFTLFLSTRDEVHTAYAKVMYAQILRSLAPPTRATGSVSLDLQEALTLLAPLAELDSPLRLVPRFLMRARYEYARALLLAGRVSDAESVARDLHEKSQQQPRHFVNSGVLLLRTLSEANRLDDAVSVSDTLVAKAENHRLEGAILAEIKISRAELLMKLPAVDFDQIDQCLSEAENLARENPVSRAVCALHRARWRALQGQIDKATQELRKWEQMGKTIENGLLRQMAKEISTQVEGLESVLRITPEDLERGTKLDGVIDMVHRWAIGRLYSRFGDAYKDEQNVQELLGYGKGAVTTWEKKLNYFPGGKRQRRSKSEQE